MEGSLSIATDLPPLTEVPETRRAPHSVPADDLVAAGKRLRDRVPPAEPGVGNGPRNVRILSRSCGVRAGRMPELVPIRYGRMLQSPFTFYRGSAAVMAADLAKTPTTGIRVQACGDCHLMNFGGFATPERNVLFDINDFDETLPAPWEWDVKRLAASFVLAARSQGISEADGQEAAVACARSYREHLRQYSEMSPLEVWYAWVTATMSSGTCSTSRLVKKRIQERVAKATGKGRPRWPIRSWPGWSAARSGSTMHRL